MTNSARVTSIEAVRAFRAALTQFGDEAEDSVVMLQLASRKAMQWLQQDRARYWPEQVRKAQEWVMQARNELERCQLRYGSEQAPSCMDQKKALEKARRRLRLCEEKVKAVKRWTQIIRQELDNFQGELGKLTNWLEADLPRATAALERMLRALDKYVGDYHNPSSPNSEIPRESSESGIPPSEPEPDRQARQEQQ